MLFFSRKQEVQEYSQCVCVHGQRCVLSALFTLKSTIQMARSESRKGVRKFPPKNLSLGVLDRFRKEKRERERENKREGGARDRITMHTYHACAYISSKDKL